MTVVDSYCPVINPFTGDTNGYIKLLIIVGTPKQLPVSCDYCTLYGPFVYCILIQYILLVLYTTVHYCTLLYIGTEY